MSVRTTADENLDQIRESIRKLNLDLVSWVADDSVWGRDEYSEEFEENLQEAITLIRQAKKLLG